LPCGLAPQFGDVYYKRITGGDPQQNGTWNVLEAGQGGPGWTFSAPENGLKTITGYTGSDKVKKNQRNGISDLAGWINIDILNGDAVPDNLIDWWTVTWLGDTYYYGFRSDARVIWMYDRPGPGASIDASYAAQKGYGYYFVKGTTLTVKWGSGTEEVYSNAGTKTMNGTCNGQSRLVATPLIQSFGPQTG
jgi:hypothetical protein